MRSVFSEDNYSAQPYVLTTSVRRFMAGGRILLDTKNRPSALGIATGVPGVGKTVAQYMLQVWLKSGEPSIQCIAVKVPPRSTPIVLAEQIFAVLNVSHSVRRVSGLADALAQIFHQQDLQLLLLDQAD